MSANFLEAPGARHRDDRPRRGNDRRLRRSGGRRHHGKDQQLVEPVGKDIAGERGQEFVAAELGEPGLGEGDRRDGYQHIEPEQHEGRDDGGARRRVLGFFVSSFTDAPQSQPQ